jgi:hypothetical protein
MGMLRKLYHQVNYITQDDAKDYLEKTEKFYNGFSPKFRLKSFDNFLDISYKLLIS